MFDEFTTPLSDDQWEEFLNIINKGQENNIQWPKEMSQNDTLVCAAREAYFSGQIQNIDRIHAEHKEFKISVEDLCLKNNPKAGEIITSVCEFFTHKSSVNARLINA